MAGTRRARKLRWLLFALALPASAEETEEAFVRALLARVQPLSFAAGVEHCGFVLREGGGYRATGPATGTADACVSDLPDGEVVASWHTHGPYREGYHGDLPSGGDVRSDASLGLHGWLATPGGRLWRIDPEAGVVRQACGPGCLPADPAFDPMAAGEVAKAYTLAGLRDRLGR